MQKFDINNVVKTRYGDDTILRKFGSFISAIVVNFCVSLISSTSFLICSIFLFKTSKSFNPNFSVVEMLPVSC
jgi:hypothetical protein